MTNSVRLPIEIEKIQQSNNTLIQGKRNRLKMKPKNKQNEALMKLAQISGVKVHPTRSDYLYKI